MTRREEGRRLHAARVAVVATVVVVAVYVGCAVGLNVFVAQRLTGEADRRIAAQLAEVGRRLAATPGAAAVPLDTDDAPIFVWRVPAHGAAQPLTVGAPPLPRRGWSPGPLTVTVHSVPFRLEAQRSGSGWVVAGESAVEIGRAESALVLPELLFGILLALVTFAGAFVVGLRASAPLELIRRRQAEFTADASHELRTPLSVVEAEVDLALLRPRSPEEYEAVLGRIAAEGRRLRTIVEDLLWLARADSVPPALPAASRSDVVAVAAACADRFAAVAARRGVALSFRHEGAFPAVVQASDELVDRLAGVLLDNACKYAGNGGAVLVSVRTTGNRVSLRIDDSGPGIAEEERAVVFDRFHRSTAEPSGSGLGLAIADSVVRMTGGAWQVGTGVLGGARMEVSWRKAAERPGPGPVETGGAPVGTGGAPAETGGADAKDHVPVQLTGSADDRSGQLQR